MFPLSSTSATVIGIAVSGTPVLILVQKKQVFAFSVSSFNLSIAALPFKVSVSDCWFVWFLLLFSIVIVFVHISHTNTIPLVYKDCCRRLAILPNGYPSSK